MNILKLFFLLTATLICYTVSSQNKKTEATSGDTLPYSEIPGFADKYTAGSIASRLIDGLGFRYYWATEGLRSEDLTFKPDQDTRTSMETIVHIYEMSEMIKNAMTLTINYPGQSPTLPFDEMRKKTLENFKMASDILKNSSDETLAQYTLKYQRGDAVIEYPFWNQINGPVSDCIWHTGQIVSYRRQSGNPFSNKVNLLNGTVMK